MKKSYVTGENFLKCRSHHALLILGCLYMTACQVDTNEALVENNTELFQAASDDIVFENDTRKKWSYPIIADLDQDGLNDILLNDHGFSIKVYWNKNGQYKRGIDVLMGDTHGITVGDYNQDGLIDVLVSRGGGSGTNARNAVIYTVTKNREFVRQDNFEEPLANMRGRSAKFVDGDNDGDLDLLLFGVPSGKGDVNSTNYIYENDGNGALKLHSRLPHTEQEGQRFTITDFNRDGIADFVLFGSGQLIFYQGSGDLSYLDVTTKALQIIPSDITSISEIDYDKDGDYDLYVTRGTELKNTETFHDPQSKTLAFHAKRGPFNIGDIEIGETLKLTNFQGGWPHKRIFTGEPGHEYKFIGDKHHGQDIEIVNSDALGWPDKLSNKGLYLGYVGNQKWRIAGDTFSPLTAVVYNVEDYVPQNQTDGLKNILLQNNDGVFTDVTSDIGLEDNMNGRGAIIGDYDNNGFSDLLVIHKGDMSRPTQQSLFMNKNGVFSKVEHHNIIAPELGAIGMGGVSFDYNKDGQGDILYGNEWGNWHLHRGIKQPDTHYMNITVGNSPKGNTTPLGAEVSLTSCETTQIKRVGAATAPLSQGYDLNIHFGLGDCTSPQNIEIKWTNGETQILENLSIDTTISTQ